MSTDPFKTSSKIPWYDLVPLGYRACGKCGVVTQTRKVRRKAYCYVCYGRKRT